MASTLRMPGSVSAGAGPGSRWGLGAIARGAILLAVFGTTGCGEDEAVVAARSEGIEPSPPVGTFAILAANSVWLQDRAQVIGGHVGVQRAGSGPFLFNGFELALQHDARVDPLFNVYGHSTRLETRALVGDVYATDFQHFGATFGTVSPFTEQRALPAIPQVQPGSSPISVGPGSVVTLGAGSYGAATVSGTLRLVGGNYHFSSLTVTEEARVEAEAAVDVRVSTRVSLLRSAYFGPASSSGLSATHVGLTAIGGNGGSGGPGALPAAIETGNESTLRALAYAPNGTFSSGHRSFVTGAILGRDVLVGIDGRVTFEGGFGGCDPAECDDGNPCTIDSCKNDRCSHEIAPFGTSCEDGNACNGAEICNVIGRCIPGPLPEIDDDNPCTDDSCDPAIGVIHTPVAAGTPCPAGDLCHGPAACDGAGVCEPGLPIDTDDGNPCTIDSCDPEIGVIHELVTPGTSCQDDDVCDGPEICTPAGVCQGFAPDPLPSECTDPPPESEFCGDGIRDPVTEECDDGPGTEEDSCTPDCRVHNIFVRPVSNPGGLRERSRTIGYGRHPLSASSLATAVVFTDTEGSVSTLKCALFDAYGRRGELLDLGAGAKPSQFADAVVAAVPQGAFVAAWNDLSNGAVDVALRRIEPVSSPMLGEVSYANTLGSGAQQDPDVLWTGSEVVVAWTGDLGTRVRRFLPDLTPLSSEQALGVAGEVTGAVALSRFGSGWAAAWRALDTEGDEIIRVHAGALNWTIGPFLPGAPFERPALVEVDAGHLLVVFTEGTDPLDEGTPSVHRLRAAILDTSAPGTVPHFALDPLREPYASEGNLSLRRPTLARVFERIYLGWESEGRLGDGLGAQVWVQELLWDAGTDTLSRSVEETVQVDAPEIGTQLAPAFAASFLIPQGALLTVWEEHDSGSLHETLPDVFFGLRPAPFVRLPPAGGG